MPENNVHVTIVDSPEKAPDYNKMEPNHVGVSLKTIVIVKDGTTIGNPTVDLVLTDTYGNTYIAMVTGKILSTVGKMIDDM